MYRRGLPNPVPVSRSDAAATRDFYSKPAVTDAPTLDDHITEYENELKYGVDEARAVSAGGTLPAHLISEIVAHLTIRAAYLREFIDSGVSELVTSIDTLIHRPTELLDSIEFPKHCPPSKFEKMALEQFEQHPLSLIINLTPKAVVRLLYQVIREDFDLLQNAASSEFSAFLGRFKGELKSMSKKAHTQVLEKELVPESQKTKLEEFQWRVVNFPSADAVLPDCVAIAEDAIGWGPYIMADHKSMTRVVVPLSSSKLAVGSIADDWDEVAEIYGKTSRDSCFTFYLANRKGEVSQTDLVELGSPARSIIADLTSSALREAVEEFIGDDANVMQENSEPCTWTELSKGEGCSYFVSFKDFGDLVYAQNVAESLNEAVKAFGGCLPIQRLDGITFAVDYAAAIQELDRGIGVDRSIDPSVSANPNGIAMPLSVRCDDGIKTHIILRGYLAEQLIAEDESLREEAIAVIYYCLGTVAFNTLLEGKFPGTLLSPSADKYEGWLYQYNDTLLATYFSTGLLSPKTEKRELYSEQAGLQLEQMISVTTNAHTQYQTDGNHNRYFGVCASQVSEFMTAMTRFLAARASEIGPYRPREPLDEKLSQFELMKWSVLFEKDLAAFNHRLEDWVNMDEMYFLNRHFERLLFEVGVLPDQLNDGSLYIHTSVEHRLASRS